MARPRFRIAPPWWPVLAAASPVLAPWLAWQTREFYRGRREAAARNEERLRTASRLELPALERFELTVVVDYRHADGFLGDAGVSYLLTTERGTLLMDVGFGPQRPAFAHNAARLGIDARSIDALAISHLHPDHMGGLKATRARTVAVPASFQLRGDAPCYTPGPCGTANGQATAVDGPRLLAAGVASTGPLARMLCLTGLTEEQAFVAHVRGKGLVVITGCGHPTIELILAMARRLSDAPLYAVIGGLHFPITDSRGALAGIQLQQIIGTGKPWWSGLTDADLDGTIRALNEAAPPRLLLSAHDTCDHALERLAREVRTQSAVLEAGRVYRLGAAD